MKTALAVSAAVALTALAGCSAPDAPASKPSDPATSTSSSPDQEINTGGGALPPGSLIRSSRCDATATPDSEDALRFTSAVVRDHQGWLVLNARLTSPSIPRTGITEITLSTQSPGASPMNVRILVRGTRLSLGILDPRTGVFETLDRAERHFEVVNEPSGGRLDFRIPGEKIENFDSAFVWHMQMKRNGKVTSTCPSGRAEVVLFPDNAVDF